MMLKIIADQSPSTWKCGSPIIFAQRSTIKPLITKEKSPSVTMVTGIDKILIIGLIIVLMQPSTIATTVATHHLSM
jgi:hypothetical protein